MWLDGVVNAAHKCRLTKRNRQKHLPSFYSSETGHHLNKMRTAIRSNFQPHKISRLEVETSTPIDMDKTILLNNTNSFSANEAFAMFKKSITCNSFPRAKSSLLESATTDEAKSNVFNNFSHLFHEPDVSTVFHVQEKPDIKLDITAFIKNI